jgi:hypothetical protein
VWARAVYGIEEVRAAMVRRAEHHLTAVTVGTALPDSRRHSEAVSTIVCVSPG